MNSKNTNLWSFLFLGIFSIILLTMGNNAIYYSNRNYHSKQELDRIVKVLASSYENCLVDLNRESCQNKLVSTINGGVFSGGVTVKDKNENILFNYNKKEYFESRHKVAVKYFTGDGDNLISIEVSREVAPPLFISTFRSLTFSLFENENRGFFYAILRSINSILFTCMILILGYVFYKMDSQRQRFIQLLESRNFRDRNNLAATRERVKSLIEERNNNLTDTVDLSSYIKDLEDQIYEYIAEKEKDNIADCDEILDLKINTVSKTSIEYSVNKNANFDDFKYSDSELIHAATDHHGKNYVKSVYKLIKDDEIANKIISKITSGEIVPKKGDTAELRKISQKYPTQAREGYLLDIFSSEGYCAEIILAPSLEWQALLASEYIVGNKGLIGRKIKLTAKV